MKTLCITCCLLLLKSVCHAQASEETAIRNRLQQQCTAWNSGNINGFMETYFKSDSLLFVSNPPVWGWQQTTDNYKRAYPDTAAMGKLKFELWKVERLSDDYYFVAGNWQLTRTAGDAAGVFTLLFRKIAGEWFIVVDHSN